MTNDPATWTQGKLLQEVYRLKGIQTELVEALKELVGSLETYKEDKDIWTFEFNKAKQALEKASQ